MPEKAFKEPVRSKSRFNLYLLLLTFFCLSSRSPSIALSNAKCKTTLSFYSGRASTGTRPTPDKSTMRPHDEKAHQLTHLRPLRRWDRVQDHMSVPRELLLVRASFPTYPFFRSSADRTILSRLAAYTNPSHRVEALTPTPGTASARGRTPLGGGRVNQSAELQALQTQVGELTTHLEGLEKERDFYFDKLRQIEILVQQQMEVLEAEGKEDKTLKEIQAILYSTEVSAGVHASNSMDRN